MMNKAFRETLSTVVSVNEQFARSTRIDGDSIDETGFIYSESIDMFLRTLIRHQSKSQQGAYTWTGPYGSGKSTLALSLSAALYGEETQRSKAVKLYNDETAADLWQAFPPLEEGWKIISVIGGRGDLETLLTDELNRAGIVVDQTKFGKDNLQGLQKHIVSELEHYIESNPRQGGVLIFVDEMGKLLEAAADGFGDVYFYQLLAEAASRSGGKLVLIGILHQSFQEYANSPLKRVRDEWGKIHGRFVDITINLNSSEQIELIASSLAHKSINEKQAELAHRTVKLLSDAKKAPSENLPQLLEACWPLNPMTALLLGPISKRSYGQNQRSIFSFLASGEPLGLRDFLDNTEVGSSELYDPPKLWNYLDVNWGSSIAVSGDSHHFANAKEVLARLETMPNAKDEHSNVIKTISILDLTSQITGVTPSHKALQVALDLSPHKITKITNDLTDESLIIFKKYKNAYALFEGSDFDIEAELANKLKVTSPPKLSEITQHFLSSEIVAKRHYLQSGTMRWAEIKLCTPDEVSEIVNDFQPNTSKFALLLIISSESAEEYGAICDKYLDHEHVIFGRNSTLSEVQEYFIEYYALSDLLQNSNALLKDKVARRELRDRISSVHDLIENKINEAIDQTDWETDCSQSVSLSKIASDAADKIFRSAPIIHNELVNREKPSGSANAAVKSLLYAAVDNSISKNLGFKKFPPERGLYEAIIKKNNLHVAENGLFKFQSPLDLPEEIDIARLGPLWTVTLEHLKNNAERNVTLTELHAIWSQPPYGVKAGLNSILTTLFYITHRSQIAYYREGIFVTDFQDFDVDYIHKTPALVEFRWLDMDTKTKRLLTALATIPAEIDGSEITSIEPLEVARSLISTFDKIEPWTLRTNRVSDNCKKIRSLFKRASDPAQFTLNDIPELFGEISLNKNDGLNNLTSTIKDGLLDLREFFSLRIAEFRTLVLKELHVYGTTETSFAELRKRAEKIRGIAGQFKLDSVSLQLSKIENDDAHFERLAGAIIGKTSKNWIDLDYDRLLVETISICREFRNLETMTDIKGMSSDRYAFALVDHNSLQHGPESPTVFEITQAELDDASRIVKSLKAKHSDKAEQRKLLAAFAILSKEWSNSND
jgi:predicted HTH domain antitoxin